MDGSPTNGYELDTGPVPRFSRTLAAGSYIVGVRVTDKRGAFAQTSKGVLIRSVPRVRLVGNGGRVKVRRGRFTVSLAGCSACTGRVGAATRQ